MAKIIGIQSTSFVGKSGNEVTGKVIFLTEPIDPTRGQGDASLKIFLSTAKSEALSFKLALNVEVEILYNRFGKVQTLRQLSDDNRVLDI